MIWLVQLLCPQRHCLLAAAYDEAVSNPGEAIEKLRELGRHLKLNPWCGICGSTVLHYEPMETVFHTMEEALPELAKSQAEQLITSEVLSRLPKLN